MYNTATLSKLQILKQEDLSYTKQSAEDEFLVPIYAMSVITFQEKFSPFLSVDMTTKNKVSIKLSYNQDRNIGLNLANSYVNELSNKDFVVRVGFTPSTALGKGKSAKVASREGETNQRGGESVTASIFGKSTQPVTFRRILREMRFDATLTIRDTRTIQRKLDSSPVVSQGFTSFAFNPIASFEVNSKLLLSAYYEKNFNTPYVSNIYYRSEDRAGIRVTFKLSE
jgi:cell surface protein SprA